MFLKVTSLVVILGVLSNDQIWSSTLAARYPTITDSKEQHRLLEQERRNSIILATANLKASHTVAGSLPVSKIPLRKVQSSIVHYAFYSLTNNLPAILGASLHNVQKKKTIVQFLDRIDVR